MAAWTCDGVPRDGKQYPQQNPPDKHEPYVNYGADCVICGLPKEAIVGGSTAPLKPIAAVVAGLLLLGVLSALGYLLLPKPCPVGQQKVNGVCVANTLTPPPTPVPTITSTASANSNPLTVAPAPSGTLYRTLAEVPNVPALRVRYGGSTSFAPLRSQEIVAKILQSHPGFELIYSEPPPGTKPGSGSGIRMLLDGQLSVAQSSRSLKPEELAEAKSRGFTLEQIPVAIDGIALYVSRQLSIPGLTLAQIKDIYTGKITNWNQVGGPNLVITPLSRNPQDGGTPEFFEEKVLNKESFAPSVQPYMQDTTASIRKAADTPGGIGYATASEVCNQEMVKPIPIARGANQDFVSPCEGKLVNKPVFANDTYPITRRLFAIVKRDGKLDEQAGVAYANLLLSEEGQQIVARAGLVPIRTP